MFVSPHPGRRESCLFFKIPAELGAVFYCCRPEKSIRLWRRLGKSVMLKIWSTAVTHRAPSRPQSHRSLLTNVGVCLRGAGERASILGPLTLTLLPSSVTTSLVACFPNYSFNHCHSVVFCSLLRSASKPSLVDAHPHFSPLLVSYTLSSHYHAKSGAISNQVPPIAPSPPCRLRLHVLCQNYLFPQPLGRRVCLFGPRLAPQSQESRQTTARVCAHVRRFDVGMNRGLVRLVRERRMSVFMVMDSHALQKTALCV